MRLSVVLTTVFMLQESFSLSSSLSLNQWRVLQGRGCWVEHYVNFNLCTKIIFILCKNTQQKSIFQPSPIAAFYYRSRLNEDFAKKFFFLKFIGLEAVLIASRQCIAIFRCRSASIYSVFTALLV